MILLLAKPIVFYPDDRSRDREPIAMPRKDVDDVRESILSCAQGLLPIRVMYDTSRDSCAA
jgi:hypothetical protein